MGSESPEPWPLQNRQSHSHDKLPGPWPNRQNCQSSNPRYLISDIRFSGDDETADPCGGSPGDENQAGLPPFGNPVVRFNGFGQCGLRGAADACGEQDADDAGGKCELMPRRWIWWRRSCLQCGPYWADAAGLSAHGYTPDTACWAIHACMATAAAAPALMERTEPN